MSATTTIPTTAVIGYELTLEALLEASRQNPRPAAQLTPTKRAWGRGYFHGSEGVPVKSEVRRLHPEYSTEEVAAYIQGATDYACDLARALESK
jgi:hypothetical protein